MMNAQWNLPLARPGIGMHEEERKMEHERENMEE